MARSDDSVAESASLDGNLLWNAFRRKQRYVVDLGQVVILGCQPENRNAIDAGSRGLLRQLDRRQRLENGKKRTAEQPNLLASHNCERAGAKAVQIRQRFRGRTPRPILSRQNLADLRALGLVVTHKPRFFLEPLGEIRRTRVNAANGRRIGKVIEK